MLLWISGWPSALDNETPFLLFLFSWGEIPPVLWGFIYFHFKAELVFSVLSQLHVAQSLAHFSFTPVCISVMSPRLNYNLSEDRNPILFLPLPCISRPPAASHMLRSTLHPHSASGAPSTDHCQNCVFSPNWDSQLKTYTSNFIMLEATWNLTSCYFHLNL